MSSSNTSFQIPVTGKGEDLTGLLVVVVAVLGTLVAVGLLAGGVWACVVCSRILYRRRKWQKRQKFGIEGFPPHPREMVELGHIPHLPYTPHHLPYTANNTGISRSLGLCTSQPAEQLPDLPTPKSWTPSPPFGCKQNHAPRGNVQYSSCTLRKKKRAKRARTVEIHSYKLDGKKSTPNDTQRNTSPYHPGYNTLASDMWSVQPAYSSSYSSRTSGPSRQPPEEVDRRTRNTCNRKRHHSRWRGSKVYNKEPDNYSRYRKTVHACVDSHRPNKYSSWRSTQDEDTDPPGACSTYRGSPQPHHHLVRLSPNQHQPRSSRAEASHHLDLYQNPACNELSEDVHESKADDNFRYRRNVTQETQRKMKEEKQKNSSTYHWTYPHPVQSLTSTKSRRLWRESSGFRNEALPLEHNSAHASGPCWVHHFQTARRQHGRSSAPLAPPPHPRHDSHIVDEAREQEAFRRIARKYGFCETCGREKSLEQRQEAAFGDDRNFDQFSDLDERCDCSPDDPTPSMSWDNLTPEPSPALADTQPPPAAEGAISVRSNEKKDNDNNVNDGCGNFVLGRENTYIISRQSSGEG